MIRQEMYAKADKMDVLGAEPAAESRGGEASEACFPPVGTEKSVNDRLGLDFLDRRASTLGCQREGSLRPAIRSRRDCRRRIDFRERSHSNLIKDKTTGFSGQSHVIGYAQIAYSGRRHGGCTDDGRGDRTVPQGCEINDVGFRNAKNW